MKKSIAAILAVVLVVMLLASLLQIRNLQREMNAMQATISGLNEDIDRRMVGISERVDAQIQDLLNEQQNVFHSVEFTYGEIHMDRNTVDVCITAIPKKFSEESSAVTATVNGQEVPLTIQNGVFQAMTELDLFGESRISDIRVKDHGSVEIQQLDWSVFPQNKVLLQFKVEHTGSDESEKNDGKMNWMSDSLFEVTAYSERPFKIQSMELVEELNGKEIGRIPADLSPEAQKKYAEHGLRAGPNEAMAVPEQVAPIDEGDTPLEDTATEASLCLYISKTYELSPGDSLIRFLELTDDLGFRYRCFADCCVVTESLKRDSAAESDLECQYQGIPYTVYDKDGKLIG